MRLTAWRFWPDASVRIKMLVIILPLVVLPVLIFAAVGFVTASREAARASGRYLSQREADLRALADNPAIQNFFRNRTYGLVEEAEVVRRELEASLQRFAERSNSVELVYPEVRYIDADGIELAKVVDGQIRADRRRLTGVPFLAALPRLEPGQPYLSPLGPRMTYALPLHLQAEPGSAPALLGAVVLDFVYPVREFQRASVVIAATFLVLVAASLGVALLLTVGQVRRLTDPIRRLAEAANRLAAGQRSVTVPIESADEVGRLAESFNAMAVSLEHNETALRRKAGETATLYEIGQEISAQVTLEPTLRLIVDRGRDLLACDACTLALRQEPGDGFAIQAYSGDVAASLLRARFSPAEGVTGRVIATGEPVLVGDYARELGDSPYAGPVRDSNIRSLIAVPLKARGRVIGVLTVTSSTPDRLHADDRQLLSALGDQAAIAIEKARLFEQVRQHAGELEAKVDLRTRELQVANQQLEEASRHKSEFLANMSHELRTPLNAIIGFTRLVMRRSKDVLADKQYENLDKILVSANHLLALINDILDLSKIEAGRMEVRPVAFELAGLVEDCLRTVEPTLKSERVRLARDLAGDLRTLYTDQDKLKQILINLLSNAIKFTEVGAITVRAREDGDHVVLSVTDTGIGISEHARQVIFEEFRQADSSTTRRYGGTGLGLSISRHFARLLGGDLEVDSTVGVGSTFTLTFPARYGGPESDRAPAVEQPFPDGVAPPENGPVVLAIDDDPDAIYLIRENLAEAGYRVVGALSGDDGLRKARELRPLAITLDVVMPARDGWQVLSELKLDPVTKDIPVIVASVVDNKELGYRLGAFDYLVKPLDRDSVVAALARISPSRGRLLVVDDDPQVADLVRQLLEGRPYDIEEASDGQAALEAIARHPPDAILLDLLMPHLDGFAVIEQLQQDPQYRRIPVVVLTAKSLTGAERAFLEQSTLKVIPKLALTRESFFAELAGLLRSYQGPGRAR